MTRYRVRQVAVEIIPPIQVNGRFDIEGNDNQRFEAQVCTANVGQTGGVTGFYFGGRWLADGDGRPGASFYSDDPNLVELKAILRGKALSATMANETGKVGASFYSDDPNLVELKAILRGKALSATMANETGKVG